jgi:hypothetical protein
LPAAVETVGAEAKILRIGQIVPSRKVGSQLWNLNEAVPLMIQLWPSHIYLFSHFFPRVHRAKVLKHAVGVEIWKANLIFNFKIRLLK